MRRAGMNNPGFFFYSILKPYDSALAKGNIIGKHSTMDSFIKF